MELTYTSISELIKAAKESNCSLAELILNDTAASMEKSKEEVFKEMKERFLIMQKAIEDGCHKDIKSTSGLTGGDAYKLKKRVDEGKTLTGSFFSGALYRALAVSEFNASMGKIVAAPTAGSCGIMPAALCTLVDEGKATIDQCVMGLFTASAIGMVIANKACLAGALGGCQAECGSASAMAAGAIVDILGDNVEAIDDAVAIAIKNILGLVCDPVAGLVEIPCIKRNASGVAGAYVASELALAGIKSAIPADETIIAMKKIGDGMPSCLKETAEGGLAITPTGLKLKEQVFGKE